MCVSCDGLVICPGLGCSCISHDIPAGGTLGLTLFTERGLRAPREVQLTRECVLSHQVITRVALVGDARSPHQRDVGGRLPAVLDLGQVWAGVVPGHFCKKRKKENRKGD